MASPMLNDRSWNKAAKDPGWAAPDASTRATPITDGPISPWHGGVMTVSGTLTASGVLMVLLLAAATVGWQMGPDNSGDSVGGFPALALVGMLVGFACVIAMYFKPTMAKVLAPIYALGEGFFLGVISKAYENYRDGIVVQAIGATLGVFVVMLVLYRTQIIKVTDRFRRIIISATLGLMAFYLVVVRDQPVRWRRPVPAFGQHVRHRIQPVRRRPGGHEPGPRLRLHRARVQAGPAEGHGVVCGDGLDRHPGVVVPRDVAAARQSDSTLTPNLVTSRRGTPAARR